jgi:hypothetical protein
MTGCYHQGRSQEDPQSEKDDQPEIDQALVIIPVVLATLAFFAASEAFRAGREISVFRKDAFHVAVAISRREFEEKIVGLQRKCRCSEATVD